MNAIPHSRPCVGERESTAARAAILSRQLAAGPHVAALERGLAARSGQAYGIAVSSGTAGLFCALRALAAKPGDDVIIPSYVCAALLNAVWLAGCRPVLADVDPAGGNCTPDTVKHALTRKSVAVIVPHLFGMPAPVAEIARLGVPVIEDCAQCVGASIAGDRVGSIGDLSVFSFYATKLIAAGEGGMVTTSTHRMADRIRAFINYDKRDTWTPAFNFKLSDVQAAIAQVQLKKLTAMASARRRIADRYEAELCDLEPAILLPKAPAQSRPVWYRYIVRVRPSKKSLEQFLLKENISCGSPVTKPLHRYLGRDGFCGADTMHQTALSIPIYPDLAMADVTRTSGAIRRWVERYA